MLVSFARAVILYLALILVIRLMGKRQLGQMEPTEFVVTMLIAELASVRMQDEGIALLCGLIPILVVLAIELLLSVLVVFVCSAANTVRWLILKAELKELEEQLAELRHENALRRERERIMKQLEKETE